MLYKGVLLGSEEDHEISIWVESENKLSPLFCRKIDAIARSRGRSDSFEEYFDTYAHYRSPYFTFNDAGLSYLNEVMTKISNLLPYDTTIGISVYSNEFTHIEGNADDVSYEQFLTSISL